jgi:alkyl sulfatase BDS1-like metallo-beta-lactamase superfamily hydrolase
MSDVTYLGWFDDNPKKSAEQKIDDAVARYVKRFGRRPNLCLVNRADCVNHRSVEVRAAGHVHRNHFLVGYVPK